MREQVAARMAGSAVISRDLRYWHATEGWLRGFFLVPQAAVRDAAGAPLEAVSTPSITAAVSRALRNIDDEGYCETCEVDTPGGRATCRTSVVPLNDTVVIHAVLVQRTEPGFEVPAAYVTAEHPLSQAAAVLATRIPSRMPVRTPDSP